MKLEKYLILNKYFLSLFGVKDFKDLQLKLKDIKEGTDSEGKTYFVNTLLSLQDLKISEDDLMRYDRNIQEYEKKISYGRGVITLKYFQYLAVLFTEIFLDNLKNRKQEFLYKLNEFLKNYEDEDVKNLIGSLEEEDLKKIAFWMATGSGKTLIAHINYYQFFKYKLFEPDNIIFITPNEGLSEQHFDELEKSGIPARRYEGGSIGNSKNENEVLIIEITKFVEEKKGGGVTIPVDTFVGKNLIFVDEGHKGKREEDQEWAKRRNKLAENGFVFEYSATFGQILSKKNKEVLKEYAKAILFDYSYKYFYLDEYGKDFSYLNIGEKKISDEEFAEIMFVGNLLSFYEQLLLYEEKYHLAKEYNIEKPLWIFVGTTVIGKKKKSEEEIKYETDVLKIVSFIKKVVSEKDWLKEKIDDILNGKTGLKKEDGRDIFENRFEFLRKRNINLDDIYSKVFNGQGAFKIYGIKNAEGELGLKIGENPYFGVINIGDVSGFKKLLEKEEFLVEQDVISSSLFDDIKKENSSINILIGAKKFIEGWDTWRVSSMGLLNIGKGKGPQIIQLFGRGVRLKGKNMSLKRSNVEEIRILETLNIYGIKADYLNKFLDTIRKEEVELEEIKIPVKVMEKEKWKKLPYLKKDEQRRFEEEVFVVLKPDNTTYFTLNLIPKVSEYVGKERKYEDKNQVAIAVNEITTGGEEKSFSEIIDIDLFDWDKILKEMFEFKIIRGYWNLILTKESIREILLNGKVIALPSFFNISEYEDIEKIEEIAILWLKGYIDRFYKKYKEKFETKNIKYEEAGKQLSLFAADKVNYYTVYVDREKRRIIEKIKELSQKIEDLIKDENGLLPRIYIDESIFVPLLLENKNNENIEKISPSGLNESEKKFVEGLKEYLKNNKEKLSDCEIFLLRNEAKSGIGFRLEWASFYPDFIMWIKKEDKIYILFIDPKGLVFTQKLKDEKIQCRDKLKEIEEKLNKNIHLEFFIISDTSYQALTKGESPPTPKEEYEKKNVLFFEDAGWCEKLFSKIGIF